MAYLDKLNVSKRVLAARTRRKPDSVEYRRKKLVANLEEMVTLAKLEVEGKPLELTRRRGNKVVKVQPRTWWRTDEDGTVATEVYYNKVALNLGGRGRTIEVGPLKKLPAVYQTLIRATLAGELDTAIKAARRQSR